MAKQRNPVIRRAPSAAPGPRQRTLSPTEAVEAAQGLVAGLTRIGGLAQVDGLLDTLKGAREFATLASLGSTLDQQGLALSPRAMRLTAQGLIEGGRFSDAGLLLDRIIEHTADEAEILEARGL